MPLLRAFLRASAAFAARQPWNRVSERQSFRLRLPVPPSGGGDAIAWASVVGEQSIRARGEAMRAAAEGKLGPLPPVIRGISIFFKRFDIERR